VELKEDVSASPLYSSDLAPVPKSKRTWSMWSLAALWVGMAVCIPTYMLAAQFIVNGISWWESLIIIGLANLIITIPMVLSGHAGVKYGIPFPVLGRSSFGVNGIHLPAIIRGLIAAAWFGIQTWIGGDSIYVIWQTIMENTVDLSELSVGRFIGFTIFWFINLYFIIKGTESIKKLEILAAPILVAMGIGLIWWGSSEVGSFSKVLDSSKQLSVPTLTISKDNLTISSIRDKDSKSKANECQIIYPVKNGKTDTSIWMKMSGNEINLPYSLFDNIDVQKITNDKNPFDVKVQLKNGETKSSVISAHYVQKEKSKTGIWQYLIMLTAMVGFWATMSISIADITRFSKSQKDQKNGQFIGLPGTMILYSFVGIFVTCAATISFGDVLVREDAPWNPADLLAKFDGAYIVIISQVFLLIATLSTNIAANVIAPANAFSNAFPKSISFKMGGVLTAIIGVLIMPWSLINYIVPLLLFVSSLLGPVVAILICDYFVIRKTKLNLASLYKTSGEYSFNRYGFNPTALFSFAIGVVVAGIGNFVPSLSFLYDISWFSGFITSFVLYYFLSKKTKE
ncbi:MAG: NCS1 family nucleobase:cation symporter-1, partial [Crocinitomicaceae bacterium]|nr:NCS1 family nucleobase:cation symporter-1 [Crocinitomicaceae bacterium]